VCGSEAIPAGPRRTPPAEDVGPLAEPVPGEPEPGQRRRLREGALPLPAPVAAAGPRRVQPRQEHAARPLRKRPPQVPGRLERVPPRDRRGAWPGERQAQRRQPERQVVDGRGERGRPRGGAHAHVEGQRAGALHQPGGWSGGEGAQILRGDSTQPLLQELK